MGEDETPQAFLDFTAGKKIIEALRKGAVLEQTQFACLTDESDFLHEDGNGLVGNALRGSVVLYYDVLRATSALCPEQAGPGRPCPA